MDSRSLDEVAVIRDSDRIIVHGTQRIMRKGPYRLYAEAGWVPFDDYMLDGDFLIIGDVCDVVSPTGCLSVQRARGRCSVTDTHHVVEALDPMDSDYLYRVLRCTPAQGNADIASQTARLSQKNLRAVRIPWPDEDIRHAFCAFLDDCDLHIHDIDVRIAALQREGEADCAEVLSTNGARMMRLADGFDVIAGSSLPADKRTAGGVYPVVSAQGLAGRTDWRAVTQACVVVGIAGSRLSVRYAPGGAWPLADAIALTYCPGTSEATRFAPSLELLYFLLSNDAGRMVPGGAADPADAGSLLEFFSSAEIGCPQEAEGIRLAARAHQRISELAGCRARKSDLVDRSRSAMQDMLDMRDGVANLVASDSAGVSAAAVLPKRNGSIPAVPRPVRRALAQLVHDTYRSMMPHPDHDQPESLPIDDMCGQSPADALFDAAWEVIPLAYLRARRSDADWQAMAADADCRHTIDAWLSEEAARSAPLSYLQGLSCDRSTLDGEGRSRIVSGLQKLVPIDVEGSDLLWMHAAYLPPIPDSPTASACPPQVAQLVCGCAALFQQRVDSVFDPHCGASGLLALLHAAYPDAAASGQAPDFAMALITAMAASADGWMIPDGCLAAGSSLLDDAFVGRTADLVVSMLPPNAGEWTDTRPDPYDARWVFGEPPRNKANLAWLQHAFYHRGEGGTAVLVFCDAVLHESRGCEPIVRRNLIASGCVRAVVSLPGRIFDDKRNPSCIMVLGDPRPGECTTLFIDASGKGADLDDGSRTVPDEAVQDIMDVMRRWVATGSCRLRGGFCASASKGAMLDAGDLTPWTYV